MIASPKAGVFFDYKTQFISKYPIKLSSKAHVLDFLVKSIGFIANTSSPSSRIILQIIDSLVFNIYFPYHMKEREIDVLEFVERDIERVYSKLRASGIQKPEAFDTLPDAEKEKVIEQLHATWSNPENEVVKRMAQFKEKSPEILKPIMES